MGQPKLARGFDLILVPVLGFILSAQIDDRLDAMVPGIADQLLTAWLVGAVKLPCHHLVKVAEKLDGEEITACGKHSNTHAP
ncbi:hypothetical protein D3C71_1860210 [compost metagenome]